VASGIGRGTGGMSPPKFSKVPFFGGKCPSDNVNNFVEIENIFIFGKFIMCPNKILLFSKK
jgi:hypothetical protein